MTYYCQTVGLTTATRQRNTTNTTNAVPVSDLAALKGSDFVTIVPVHHTRTAESGADLSL